MNILLLCDGDPEKRATWSGTAKSLLDQLRASGHLVSVGDVALHGLKKWVAVASVFSLNRQRWGVKYRLGTLPFRLRSGNAARAFRSQQDTPDLVLHIGATFSPSRYRTVPYVLYCDSNIRVGERAIPTGHSQAAFLRAREINKIVARETVIYREAAALFPLSEFLRRSFIEDFGIPPERVRAVYAGPNLETVLVTPASEPKRVMRPPTILFVGSPFVPKGGDLLLRAFRSVRAAIPEARLVIVGSDGDNLNEPGVQSLGFLDKERASDLRQLLAAYRNADVFCVPTRFEAFGIVFLEAMSFGLPCVGPNAWAIPEIIQHAVTGYTYPPGDNDALADTLIRLLADPSLTRRMGQAARDRYEERFRWPLVVQRMMETIEPLPGRREE